MQFAPLCEEALYHIGGKQSASIGDRGAGQTPADWRDRFGAFVPVLPRARTSTAAQRGSRNRLSHGEVIQRYWRVALMVNTDAPALVGLLPVA